MSTEWLAAAVALPDAALLARLRALAACQREATADLVAHLAELDARRLYRGEGYGSLFSYCTVALRLSEHGAYNRIEAARSARKFPAVLDLLAEGALNLATLRLLAPHLTPENHAWALARARGRTKREVEALVARLLPRPDVPSSIRRLPQSALRRAPAGTGTGPAATAFPAAGPAAEPTPAAAPPIGHAPSQVGGASPPPATLAPFDVAPPPNLPPQPKRPIVAPLSPERYRLQFTVGRETHDRLRRIQDLLRREIPDGDPGAIFDRALTLLLEEVERKKLAATPSPRPARPGDPGSRHVPADVKRAVWRRDGGQCAFVAAGGRRCAERTFLEFHHAKPWAAGGTATLANISLRCRTHNAYEAEVFFAREELAPGRVGGAPSRAP